MAAQRRGAKWRVFFCLFALGLWPITGVGGAFGDEPPGRRAKPPQFDSGRVSATFFADVFSKLQGERPSRAEGGGAKSGGGSGGAGTMSDAGSTSSAAWDELISASSLEDEVKSLRVALNQSVTTPNQFKGKGHKAARREFVLLNMLFWIVEHYGGDVRWKEDAKALRQLVGKTAGGAKAGGNEQAYAQAKRAKEVLDKLIRGERSGIEPQEEDEVVWEAVAPRRPLMRWLEERFEADMKKWTSNENEFKANSEELLREAELVAAIGQFFLEDGMDDADDEEYQVFAKAMKAGAQTVANAVKQDDFAAAQQGVSKISRSCSDCHENYR